MVNNLEELELPTVKYGKFPSKTGFEFQYEIWTPYKFEELNKLHPIIVEIYGGPTSQAVKSRWGFGLSSHYATSNCEDSGCAHAIHVKLDGRGSGNEPVQTKIIGSTRVHFGFILHFFVDKGPLM